LLPSVIAVDGATGNWIFEHGIKKLLHDKIRIVALNSHLHLLRHFDRIVILDQGCIVADGTYAHLFEFHSDLFTRTVGKPLHEILSSSEASTEELELDSSTSITVSSVTVPTMLEQSINTVSTGKGSSSNDDDNDDGKEGLEKEEEEESKRLHPVDQKSLDPSSSSSNKQLIEKEKAAKGEVSYAVYMHYLSASLQQHHQSPQNSFYQESEHINFQSWYRFFYGIIILVMLSILFVVAQIARIAVDYYLIRWSAAGSSKDSRWGTIYFILLGILSITLLLRSAFLNYFAVLSSRTIHASVLRTVLSASIPAFFDTHTVGEILNRFSKDCETMDVNVPEFMLQMLINWLQVLAVFALCIYTSPWFLIIMLPLAVTFRNIFVYFSKVSRDLKRLDSISRSPIFAMLSETLTG
jgi:ABC-type multidrug transport system fused ATPase/permease subunit